MPGLTLTGDKEIDKKIIAYFLKTPKALVFIIFSFLSGQIWVFILITYFKAKTKGNNILTTRISKTVIGLFWFVLVDYPIHLIRNGLIIDSENVFSNYVYAILYGLAIQAIIFIIIVSKKKEK